MFVWEVTNARLRPRFLLVNFKVADFKIVTAKGNGYCFQGKTTVVTYLLNIWKLSKKPLKAIDKLSNGLKIWLQIWNVTQSLFFGMMKKALR